MVVTRQQHAWPLQLSMCRVRRPQVDTSRDRLDFKWRLQQGDKRGAHYGLLLAAAIGFPQQVLWQFPVRQPCSKSAQQAC